MDQQQMELETKRKEVKEEILALKETIPSARIFNQLGRVFKHNRWGYRLSNIILLHLILIGPVALIELALHESEKIGELIVLSLMGTETLIAGAILVHVSVQSTFDDIANRVIEKISTAEDLSKLLLWLKQSWATRNVNAFALATCLFTVLLFVISFSISIHQFVGFGLSLWSITAGLLAGAVYYGAVWEFLFVSSLKDYQYVMNAFSPADSEILDDIFEMVMKAIYLLSGYFAVVTLLFTSSLVDQQLRVMVVFPVLALGWIMVIAQFLLTRSILGAITNRAKWKTLNRLQSKINAIEAMGDLSDKETVERLLRLVDVHKHVMASKTKALDLNSVSTLFSQLMLPLLGLLLGNLDKVLKLFSP